jgi:SAM-dependent methyltransferase
MSRESERTNTILELIQLVNIISIRTVVDIGGDSGAIINDLTSKLQITKAICVDINCKKEFENITYLDIDEKENKLDIKSKSIDLILTLVSFHHFKNADKLVAEMNRISIPLINRYPGTLLIIREHDAQPEDQPYLDFVHLIEIIKRYGSNSINFLQGFHAGYFTRLGLRQSLETAGWDYIGSSDYPADIANPQKLYSSIFMYAGNGKPWLTPLVSTTQYTLQKGNLLQILDYADLDPYYKVLKKNGFYRKEASLLLKTRTIGNFVDLFQKLKAI